MPTLSFFFDFGSTYSYPAALRIREAAARAGVVARFRPIMLGAIFKAQGWVTSPFNLYPVKGRYMWRDLERVCAKEGLPFRRPSRFPRASLIGTRIACIGATEPWGPAFVRGLYAANFVDDQEIGDSDVVARVLGRIGVDAAGLFERAQSAEVKMRLRAHTDEAMAHGIFGAPSFVVGNELFWGNDRLAEALNWAARA